MCPSSWKLYLDDFPFLGSSLAHLEPKLELFEFWEFGSWWLFVARLSPIYVLFAFQIFFLPVPTRPDTRTFLQVPVPSRSQKPLPVGPCIWLLTSIKHIKRINLAKCLLIMQTSYMRIITSIAYKESRYGYGWSLDESWFPGHKISLSMLWSICAISVPLYTSMVAYKSSAVADGWDNNTQ